METDLDAAPLQLEFCSSGMTVGNGDKNNRSDRADCTNSSPLFPHNMVTILGGDSSSDNFATGDCMKYIHSERIMCLSILLNG
jgi:hypothetical protein